LSQDVLNKVYRYRWLYSNHNRR